MKILLISVLVLISRQDKFDELYSDLKWMQYKLEYSLVFDEQEDQRRKEIFITNHRFIEEHNAKNSNLKLKMNKFGHLIGAIESAYGIDDGSLPILSEQEIVDCSDIFGNFGCEGGWLEYVFEFAKTNGLLNQSFYPYTGKVLFK
ncbi:hypothetical protein RF11_11895 [Thelohanellus kitauei]|uniref:Cathepsin propeptide inhibitor domain-containing protein n=1 Tax=Thelohanellus kitauei TaxID=669202 RepID=A0A0C2ND39_THEKT|nr:hypothetical protein RF11_11895 [Thelohanellus kitauei]